MSFFRAFAPWGILLLILSEAFLVLGSFLLCTWLWVEGDLQLYMEFDGGYARTLIAVASILFGLYLADLYEYIRPQSKTFLVQQLFLVVGGAFITQAFLSYGARSLVASKGVMIGGSFLSIALLTFWRVVYARFVMPAVVRDRVLTVGCSPTLREMVEYLNAHPERGCAVVGYVDEFETELMNGCDVPWLGPRERLPQIVRGTRATAVVVDAVESPQHLDELFHLPLGPLRVTEASDYYESIFGRVLVQERRNLDLFLRTQMGPSPMLVRLQSAYSILIALIGTILTSPLMLLAYIAVKGTSSGPALFRQTRLGLNGSPFTIYKFRSMYVNAEGTSGPRKGDPRVTPLGYWLRKLRIDELPQFFNVLKGDMLIVGPRPELPQLTKLFTEKIPLYPQRLLVKPGITGWAQINHREEYEIEDTIRKLGYDLYYLKHASLALDLYVIFNTFKVMVLSKGAR